MWLNEYETLDDAKRGIGGYVDHSRLGYKTLYGVKQTWEELTTDRGLACQPGRGARQQQSAGRARINVTPDPHPTMPGRQY